MPSEKYDFDLEGCHVNLLINSDLAVFTSLVMVIIVV